MRSLSFVALVLVVACGGESTPPTPGPLVIGIVSGNHQTVKATSSQLTDAVVGKLVRKPGGTLSLSASFDGTVVNGSPVPGAVVCAVSVDKDHPLTPFTPCTNTDSAGMARFFFNTSSKAGEARAEIRGTLAGSPAVFDTAIATVSPDTTASAQVRATNLGVKQVGDTIRFSVEIVNPKDKYGNATTDFTTSYAFSTSPLPTPVTTVPPLNSTGTFAVVPAGAKSLYAKLGKATVFWSLSTP